MPNKLGACNPQQKGKRRQKLHEEQNNRGNPQNNTQHTDFDGNLIK